MSIKMYGLIPRISGWSYDEFHDYYRHPHGTMGRTMTTMRGYVQNHQIDTAKLGSDQARFDAVAEIWLDNEHDAIHFREEPNLVKYLVEDEPKFCDYGRVSYFAGESQVLQSGPAQNAGLHPGDELWAPATRPLSVKLMQFVQPDGNPDWAGEDDLALGQALGAFRHTRATPLHSMHGDDPLWIGLRELWWPTRTAFEHAVDNAPAALETLLARGGPSWTMLAQAERFI
jgi:hypothetical protein